jgi:hypothetical protein
MEEEEELSPEFIKRFTWLELEYLTTGVSLAVLQCPFPKYLVYKQLKEDFLCIEVLYFLNTEDETPETV